MSAFKFAHILHPITVDDACDKLKILRALPGTWVEKITPRIPPVKISPISGLSPRGRIEGCFIYLGLTAQQLAGWPERFCLEKILKCGRLAERTGAQLVVLGGMTAVIGGRGIEVARRLQSAVTTGRTFCIATALQSACRLIERRGRIKEDLKCTVVDASSSLGGTCSQLLIRYGFTNLTLVADHKHRLDNLVWKLLYDYGISVKITSNIPQALEKADLIVLADDIPGKEVDGDSGPFLKQESIICNLRQRELSSREVLSGDNGITLIESGVVQVPLQINFNKKFGFTVPRTIPAEVAETMILSMDGKKHSFSLGDEIRIEKVDEMMRMAQKHSFELVGYLSQNKAIYFS